LREQFAHLERSEKRYTASSPEYLLTVLRPVAFHYLMSQNFQEGKRHGQSVLANHAAVHGQVFHAFYHCVAEKIIEIQNAEIP
jgi:hypothetical protein